MVARVFPPCVTWAGDGVAVGLRGEVAERLEVREPRADPLESGDRLCERGGGAWAGRQGRPRAGEGGRGRATGGVGGRSGEAVVARTWPVLRLSSRSISCLVTKSSMLGWRTSISCSWLIWRAAQRRVSEEQGAGR